MSVEILGVLGFKNSDLEVSAERVDWWVEQKGGGKER